jgi:hypothetical protein
MAGTTHETIWYKIRYTPIRDALRGQLTARLDLRRPLEEAGLPAQIDDLLRRVVKSTRLWRLEQLEVMQELIAHFTDGLASGASADDLIKVFGDERQAAQLIRRAKRRNRPLPWHVLRFGMWSIGTLFICYSGYAAYFFSGHPSPRINYVELFNKTIETIPVQERAWTYYRRALIGSGKSQQQLLSLQSVNSTITAKDLDNLVEFARTHQIVIEWIRQGAAKPKLGCLIGANSSVNDPELLPNPIKAPVVGSDESLAGAALPSLMALRALSAMLRADGIAAGQAGNGKRLTQDILSTLNLSRQVGEKGPLLLSLISIGISESALQDVERALRDYPAQIDKQDWVVLMDRLSVPQVAADLLSLEPEQMNFDDMLQRTFTDDGAGSGRFTSEGFHLLLSNQQQGRGWQQKAAAPAIALILPSRRRLKESFTEALTRVDANLKLKLREADWHGLQEMDTLRGFPINLITPSYYRIQVATERFLGHRDGVVTAIALELYRREHGRYPESLSALVPQLLPIVPADRITGEPVKYLLKSGQPVVYSVGADRKDDGGRYTHDPQAAASWDLDHTSASKGDWMLYPTLAP